MSAAGISGRMASAEVRVVKECLTTAIDEKTYQTTPQNITIHLKAIYAEGELEEPVTCKEYLQVQQEGSGHDK